MNSWRCLLVSLLIWSTHTGCASSQVLQRFERCRIGCEAGSLEDCHCVREVYLEGERRADVREAISDACLERGERCDAVADAWNLVAERMGQLVVGEEEGTDTGEAARLLPDLKTESESLRSTLTTSCRRGRAAACEARLEVGLDPSSRHRSWEGWRAYVDDFAAREAVCDLEPELREGALASRAGSQTRQAHEVAVKSCFFRARGELEMSGGRPRNPDQVRVWLKRACDGGHEEACLGWSPSSNCKKSTLSSGRTCPSTP